MPKKKTGGTKIEEELCWEYPNIAEKAPEQIKKAAEFAEGYKHFSKTRPMKSEHFDPVREWWNNRIEIKDQDTDTWKAKKYTAQEIADGGFNLDLCGYPHEEEEILAPLDLIQQYQEKRASLNAEIDHVLDEIVALLPHDEGGEQ